MTETFAYPGRAYFAIAMGLIIGLFISLLMMVEQTRHGAISNGEVLMGLFCLFFLGGLIIYLRQTCAISVDDRCIARTIFRRRFQELRWEAIGRIKFRALSVPAETSRRLIVIVPSGGRGGISISDRVERFEYFASLVAEIASRRNIEVEHSDEYRKLSRM